MKKIIALFVLFLAFTTNATAQTQDKSSAHEVNAKRDYEALAQVVKLTPETQDAVVAVLRKKYEALAQPNLTDENKEQIKATIEKKLQKALGPDALKELNNHKSVYKQLISDTSL
ncbi:hypothetical protein ABGT15_01720 [Flavobacterium enshiense]|uniref:hypothetical protein n=1 Tax=Flavobacterium enshiense TaxID=1341165 RepID=UPI00345C7D21